MLNKTATAIIAVAALSLASSACIVHTKNRPAERQQTVKKKGKCKPSHTWDGKKCRHKGKGKGARKHDY